MKLYRCDVCNIEIRKGGLAAAPYGQRGLTIQPISYCRTDSFQHLHYCSITCLVPRMQILWQSELPGATAETAASVPTEPSGDSK